MFRTDILKGAQRVAIGIAVLLFFFVLLLLQPAQVDLFLALRQGEAHLLASVYGPCNLTLAKREWKGPLFSFPGVEKAPDDRDEEGRAEAKAGAETLFSVLPSGMASKGKQWWALLIKQADLKSLTIEAEFGLGDPASTGLLFGFLWMLNGFLPALLAQKFDWSIEPDSVKLTPSFTGSTFILSVRCILAVRFVHVIIARLSGMGSR